MHEKTFFLFFSQDKFVPPPKIEASSFIQRQKKKMIIKKLYIYGNLLPEGISITVTKLYEIKEKHVTKK